MERLFRHELRQADEADPLKIGFAGVVHAVHALLPPQAFQRRHHIVKVALQLVFAQLAHLDGEGHSVEQAQRLFVGAVFLVGVALPAHRQKIHGGHRDDAWRFGRKIEFLVFFFVVEGHGHFLLFLWGQAFSASQVMRTRAVIRSRSSTSSTRKESLAPS